MPLPTITLSGNLTADPELKFTANGKAFVSLRVACNAAKKDEAGNWVDGDTAYMSITSWRDAEEIARLHKGTRVAVQGVLKQRDYQTREGEKRTAYEVNADYIAEIVREKRAPGATSSAAPAWGNTATAPAWDDEAPF